ncbi:hypothetical protein [Lysobacter tyrosinilyticus]
MALVLGACNAPRSPRPDPEVNWPVSPRGYDCTCPGAREFYLFNNTGVMADISFSEYLNYTHENRVVTVPHGPLTVLPGEGGRKSLGCSPSQDDHGECRVTHGWNVDGRYYDGSVLIATAPTGAKNLKAAVAALDKQIADPMLTSQKRLELERVRLLNGGASSWEPREDCVAVCQADSGTDCIRTPLQANGTDPTPEFVRLVKGAGVTGAVPIDAMLRVLGQATNVCERSDLSITKGDFMNSGYACTWTAGEGSMELQVQIPDTLSGRISYPGDRMRVDFHKPELLAPSLHFKSAPLDRKWGGPVARVEQAKLLSSGEMKDFLVLTGRSRCIAVKAQ